MKLVRCIGQEVLFQRAKPVPDRLFVRGSPEISPFLSVVCCHNSLQHRFLFFAPALGLEELVPKSSHIAERAFFYLLEELSFNNVARFTIGKSARASLDGCSFGCWGDVG